MILNAFYEGGWGMWPTLFFGLIAIWLGQRYAHKPEIGFDGTIIAMSAATLMAGLLGTITGFMNTFRYVGDLPPDERSKILLVGIYESLWNVVLALVMITVVTLVAAYGRNREQKDRGEFARS